jgi:hypothetical protein
MESRMPRTSIAAVLAILLLLAPAASARPIGLGDPTPEPAKPMVMPERITDHPYVATKAGDRLSALVREQESTTGSGNQAVAPAEPAGQAELRARGRDGVQTGSLAGTTDATTRALEQERAYSTYGAPEPVKPVPAQAADDDSTPWLAIGAGLAAAAALLLAVAALLVARTRRVRVAA